MQKFLTIIGFCLAISLVNIQATFHSPKQEPVSGIVWDKLEHDFGDIHAGDTAMIVYTVSNNRMDTFVIENVVGGCSCTVTKWTHSPVLPGMKADVSVSFNSKGKSGHQNKSVTVYTNKGYFTLVLKANIIK